MGRATTKSDMITAAISNYEKLSVLISELTEEELSTSFDFTADDKKKEAHWGRDKNLRDVLIHSMNGINCCLIGFNQIEMEKTNRLFQNPITGKLTEI